MGHVHLGHGPEAWASARLMPQDPIYLGLPEVCTIFGVSRGTAISWIKAGLMPALQLGGKGSSYRVPASWVIETCRKGLEWREAQ